MFGYVTANSEALTEEERSRYKAIYCGLCSSLKKRCGQRGRFILNYDMTFLIMVLDSLYEPSRCESCERCLVHPLRRRDHVMSEISEYAADMDIALTYLKLMDDWTDDKNPFSLLGAKTLKKDWRRVERDYPRQCGVMNRCMDSLRELELSGVPDPDRGARLFGELLGEIFVYRQDRWESLLREMACDLGEFIYIMDAAVDLEKDMKKGRYNPLAAMSKSGKDDEYFRELLKVLIGECTIAFDKLPLIENVSIMRNILCSGVWTRFELMQSKKQRKGEKRR